MRIFGAVSVVDFVVVVVVEEEEVDLVRPLFLVRL